MVKVGDLWCLKGDMHIHSHYSDGERLEKNLAQIVNCGFDFCAMTDHDTFSGSRAALETVKHMKSSFPIVVRGQEATCSGCHILAYGTHEDFIKTAPLDQVCRNIRAAGGYAVAAHPDWEYTRRYLRESGLFDDLVRNGDLDGVELMNFHKPDDPGNIVKEWANAYCLERIGSGFPLSVTCGSDAHRACEITPERYLCVFAETPDERGILDAVFHRRLSVAVWGDCVIGSKEACELFYSMPAKKQEENTIGLKSTILADGMLYQVCGAEHSMVCGSLTPRSGNSFFKAGFDHGCALILSENQAVRHADYIEIPDKIEIKCVPEFSDGKIRAKVSFTAAEDTVLKLNVNGTDFQYANSGGDFECTAGKLDEYTNCINAALYDKNGVILSRRSWDFPVALLNKWYDLQLLAVDAPSPDGTEPSARFKFTKRENTVFLDMEINDRFFCQPCRGFSMYMGDSVQFGLDFDCAASENDLIERKIWELGIAVTDENGCDFVVYNFPAASERKTAEAWHSFAERRGNTSFCQVGIPAEFFNPSGVAGFNMIFNINDGSGRRGFLAWRKGIGDRKKSADWGYILLNELK